MKWKQTGRVPPGELEPARLQLHYGALLLGSTAHSLLPHASDDSHTNLGVEHASLRTRALDPGGRVTLGLEMIEFALALRDQEKVLARLDLNGATVGSAIDWVAAQLQEPIGEAVSVTLREYADFPASPLAEGGAFAHPGESQLADLAAWFENGERTIDALRNDHPELSSSRVWPHHFDLGALLAYNADASRSIGVGLSPGDEYCTQPYFYCSPYPRPQQSTLPPLAIGTWHTKDLFSAIATAEDLQAAGDPATGDPTTDELAAAAEQYVVTAFAACKALVT